MAQETNTKGITTIQVNEVVWKRLNDLRRSPKETLNNVLERILTDCEIKE